MGEPRRHAPVVHNCQWSRHRGHSSSHDSAGNLMVKDRHDIVGSSIIMSPTRRLDDYEHERTRPTTRSGTATRTRPTPARYLSRFEPLSFLVRQMVGRI